MIHIIPIDDHDSLNELYERNDLEISDEEPVGTDAVQSWVLKQDGETAGAATLAVRQGEYIRDGIALEPSVRGGGLGTALLKTVIEDVSQRGGSRIYLVARAPEFFAANGFCEVDRADAPMFFECFGCDQYNVKCFPKVMKYELDKAE